MMKSGKFRTKSHFLKGMDVASLLIPEDANASSFTGTKIVATLGPACNSVETLGEMLEAGMTAGRVDLTWGPVEYHQKSLDNLQKAALNSRRLCANIVDLLGRTIMVRRPFTLGDDGWPTHEPSFTIKAGQEVVLTGRADAECSPTLLPITYDKLHTLVAKGDSLYVGRYLVSGADAATTSLEVVDIQGQDIVCVARTDAIMDGLLTIFHAERSSEGCVNVQNDLPPITEYDKAVLRALAASYEIDFVSVGPVRGPEDLQVLRGFLNSVGLTSTRVIAKIGTRQGFLNIKAILNTADAVILGRGNLGLDCSPEKMALVQKGALQYCNLVGKPVLITRVVDTMVSSPRPTRAEATDVANAVLDGADGILLGVETLQGRFPVQAVSTVARICRQAEQVFDHDHHFERLMNCALEAQQVAAALPELGADGSPVEGSSPVASVSEGLSTLGLRQQYSTTSLAHLAARSQATGHELPAGAGGFNSNSRHASYSNLHQALHGLSRHHSPVSSVANLAALDGSAPNGSYVVGGSPYMSKLESIASSAVKAADKVGASLIVVFTHTGATAQLVAKYRPPMPIMTLVVPHLVSDSIHWRLEGRSNARQCLLSQGLLPVLAAPSSNGESILEEAISAAAVMGLVGADDHVVCVQRIHDDFCVKIVSVAALGNDLIPAAPPVERTYHRSGSLAAPPTLSTRKSAKSDMRSLLTTLSFDEYSEPRATMSTGSLIAASPGRSAYRF